MKSCVERANRGIRRPRSTTHGGQPFTSRARSPARPAAAVSRSRRPCLSGAGAMAPRRKYQRSAAPAASTGRTPETVGEGVQPARRRQCSGLGSACSINWDAWSTCHGLTSFGAPRSPRLAGTGGHDSPGTLTACSGRRSRAIASRGVNYSCNTAYVLSRTVLTPQRVDDSSSVSQ